MKILEALKKRHSAYSLSKKSKLSDEALIALVEEALLLTPSAFNAQSQRIAILFGRDSDRFWDNTLEEVKKVAPKDGISETESKIKQFKGQGTILYFIDMDTVHNLEKNYPLYKENFYNWAQQENAMLQLVIWTALSESDLGASLQHYNPLIDEMVYDEFNLDRNWKLIAQMPFGGHESEIILKEKMDLNERLVVFK